MTNQTATIDVQVHAYERNSSERPWSGVLTGPDEVTGDDMVAAMDAVGVDGALLVSPFSMYRYDASYAMEARAAHPGRFGLIKPFDPHSESVEEEIANWASLPGVVGARIMLTAEPFEPDDSGVNRILSAGGKAGIPINIMCSGKLPLLGELARRNPETQIVVDHVGLLQPHEPPAPPDSFGDLANVVSLAAFDNVAIKISGACTLSQQPFPYLDIWEPLSKILDAFGIERCMWGTDWTRATSLVTYAEATEAFRHTDTLTEHEKSMLMGGTLQQVFGWTPTAP